MIDRGPSKSGQLQIVGGNGLAALIGTLKGADVSSADHFGASIALSSSVAVVGAPDHAGGRVYVFDTSGNLRQIAELEGSDTSASDEFGYAVAASGSTLVVGAPGHDGGRAYVFTVKAGAWRQVSELQGSGASHSDQFGTSVAVSGATVVVGAPGHNQAAGAAYVFRFSAGRWVQAGVLAGSDTVAADQFGSAVAVSDTALVVGAASHQTGAFYAFGRTRSGWSQTGELATPQEPYSTPTGFGNYLSLSGSTVFTTSPGNYFASAKDQVLGPVRIWNRTPSRWTGPGTLAPPPGISGVGFATAVSVPGQFALIGGAPGIRAYLFVRTAQGWRYAAELRGPSIGGGLTSTVAISGSSALVAVDRVVDLFEI